MDNNFKITIPKPCHENWEGMTTTKTGKFCAVCTKNVVDFTTMLPTDIQQYFTANKEKNICGRFKNDQLETLIIQVPSTILYSQMPFHKAFLLALFVAMGTTLFSCKDTNGNPQTIDKVEVVDSLKVKLEPVLLGDTIVTPPKPNTNKVVKDKVECETEATTGMIYVKPEVAPQIDTTKHSIIMGKPAPPKPEIMGEPAVEEIKK